MLREDFWEIQEKYNNILKEGYMRIPQEVIKEIKDYYKVYFKKYYNSSSEEISESEYPSKLFYLDLSNTNYKFLSFIKPKPQVLIKFNLENSTFQTYDNNVNLLEKKNRGVISLELSKDPKVYERMMSEIIEHEVLHYIQYLLHKYKNRLAGSFHSKDFKPNVDIYGHSYTQEGKRRKRVRHDYRPIEYYTNLMSSIRELNLLFYKKNHTQRHWDLFKKWERPKVYFFKHFLNVVNEIEEDDFIEQSIAVDSFREWKRLSPEVYRKIVKIAYDAFVNREQNFDPEEIKDELLAIEKD